MPLDPLSPQQIVIAQRNARVIGTMYGVYYAMVAANLPVDTQELFDVTKHSIPDLSSKEFDGACDILREFSEGVEEARTKE